MNTEQRDGTKLGASLCNTNNILVWYSYCPVYIVSALCNTTSTTRSIILWWIYLGKKEFIKLFVVLHEETNLFPKKSLFIFWELLKVCWVACCRWSIFSSKCSDCIKKFSNPRVRNCKQWNYHNLAKSFDAQNFITSSLWKCWEYRRDWKNWVTEFNTI